MRSDEARVTHGAYRDKVNAIRSGPLADNVEDMQAFMEIVVDALGPHLSPLAKLYAYDVARALWQLRRLDRWSTLALEEESRQAALNPALGYSQADWLRQLGALKKGAGRLVLSIDERELSREECDQVIEYLSEHPAISDDALDAAAVAELHDLPVRIRTLVDSAGGRKEVAEWLDQSGSELLKEAQVEDMAGAGAAANKVLTGDLLPRSQRADAHLERKLSRAIDRLVDQQKRDKKAARRGHDRMAVPRETEANADEPTPSPLTELPPNVQVLPDDSPFPKVNVPFPLRGTT